MTPREPLAAHRWHRRGWLVSALFAATVTTSAQLSGQPTIAAPEQLERRLQSVMALIETSSGAKQVEASGNPEALARRDAAREIARSAEKALAAGDSAKASGLVAEASRKMIESVRLAAPEQITSRKDRIDFDARMEATRTLLDAQKRIIAEKGSDARATQLARSVEALLAEATRFAAEGRLPDARRSLDQAYLVAKAAIGGLRGGDTLVRTLNFATKEEEFRYEIDRNDTHRMLVDVLLTEKRGAAGTDASIERALKEAARLRGEADALAARRDYEAGIRSLEDSTRELVRAIRGAGVYIPG